MKTAKSFQNGKSQAVRLSKEFCFDGDRIYVKRVGNAIVISKPLGWFGEKSFTFFIRFYE
jgi:virulence-associated protein VagC